MFKVGDKVVYPHHGAGTVVKKEKREVLGAEARVPHDPDPAQRHDRERARRERGAGRPAHGDRRGDGRQGREGAAPAGEHEMPKNWNRRFKHNRDKMKTGDIFELAEVVRNLSLRDHEKGLSTGEKQMFVKAKKILASELMYAKADGRGRGRRAGSTSVLAGQRREAEEEEQGEGRSGQLRSARSDMSVWAVLVAAGTRRAAGRGPAEGVRAARRAPAARREPRAARRLRLGRRDRRRRSGRVGGAGDPARRGASAAARSSRR